MCFILESNTYAQKTQTEEQKKSITKETLVKMLQDITADVEKQRQAGSEGQEGYQLEIDGLIIDETKTKIGRDFYDIFFKNWERPPNISGFTIYIREMAHPRFGSFVWVFVDNDNVYQNILRPRYDVIDDAAKYGVFVTQQFLIQHDRDQRQLSGEDMTGTGIY